MAEVTVNELPIGQAAVLQVRVDYAFTLILKRGDDAFEMRIEQAFEFVTPDGAGCALDPEGDPIGLGVALGCARTEVAAARAFDDGRLEMSFADGSVIRVPISDEYEGWELVGPRGLRMVAGPGGKLTAWTGNS